ncbi:hypothetical protein J7E95_19230 [Streptomyces sp. ISL-14]|nr:hypothetical protein [Streptomyces sp. ISL-14]
MNIPQALYNTIGDEVADVSPKIQATINFLSTGVIIVPAGNYKLLSSIVKKPDVNIKRSKGVKLIH